MSERNNSADTKVSEEGGGGGAPGTGGEIPLQPMMKTMVRQAVPLQPMEVHGGAQIHLQPMEDPMSEQGNVPEGDCDPMESQHWSRLLAGLVTPCWSSPFFKDCTLWKGPTLKLLMKNCCLYEGPTLEKFMEDCFPWEGPMLEQGKRVRRKERQRQCVMN
ncbi:protein pxr1-like [Limosa lapponica baueri]|uniref:Protein pxr1-like n=1 Tax=Limosa lapponica baueri TaxID=1758121 RepID=A0A2I0UAC3_LIMLA|nr:protein pxr1-like [Limosa lapponica baueri]